MATNAGFEAFGKKTAGYTNEYMFVRGDYKIGLDILPYYSITIPVSEAIQHFKLSRDVILDPTAPVGLEELFQRDLDPRRVQQEIIPYLQESDRIKFFNSLTVTILPMDPSNENRVLDKFPQIDPEAPSPPADNLITLPVGPVRIRHLQGEPKFGKIS